MNKKFYSIYPSPIGEIYIVASENSLLNVSFNRDVIANSENNCNKIISAAIEWLSAYFMGENPEVNALSISMNGTPFQKEVWQILMGIPYGQAMTYGEIASIIAKEKGISKMSAQAVGNAVGKNPICIIIPCHRVLGKGGVLTGYAYGLSKKAYLLQRENIGYKEK